MTGVFRANNPYNNFLLFLYALVLRFPMFLGNTEPVSSSVDGFLYDLITRKIENITAFPAAALLAFFLVLSQALMLNHLVNRYRMMQKSNYLTGMSYLLISSLFTEWYRLSSVMMVSSFLIWALSRLSDINTNPNPRTTIFNIGMLIGISAFFYYPAVFFLVFIFLGLAFSRPFRIQEWLLATLGLIAPYYFLIAVLFLRGRLDLPSIPAFSLNLPNIDHRTYVLIAVILITIAVLAGVYFVNQNMRRQIVQTRKNWNLVFFYLLLAILLAFFNPAHEFGYFFLAIVPLSMLTGAAFLYPDKRWFRVLVHWSMAVLALITGYYLRK